MFVTEILLDTSGSMKDSRLSFAKEMLIKHINPIIIGHHVFLRTFNSHDKKPVISSIATLPNASLRDLNLHTQSINHANGGTPISSALTSAIENLKKYPYEQKTIVLVTDGVEDKGGDYISVAKKAKQEGIDCRIHIVGVDLNIIAENKAKLLVNETGGVYVNIDSKTGQNYIVDNSPKKSSSPINTAPVKNIPIPPSSPIGIPKSPITTNTTDKNVAATLSNLTNAIDQKADKDLNNLNQNNIINNIKSKDQETPQLLELIESPNAVDDLIKQISQNEISDKTTSLLVNEIERLRKLVSRYTELSILDNSNITVSGDKEYTEKIRRKSEKYIWKVLKKHYPGRVKWLNKTKESFSHYDFEIINSDGTTEFFIDCKGTAFHKRTFYITFKEWEVILLNPDKYQIYRVFNVSDESNIYHTKIDNIFSWLSNGILLPYLVKTETIQGGRIALTLK